MKRLTFILLITVSAFMIAFTNQGCVLSYGNYPITYVFDDPQFVSIIEGKTLPVEIRYGLGGEGGYEQWSSSDSEMINRYIDVFRNMEIKREITDNEEFVNIADAINDYSFCLKDGTEIQISFELNKYVTKDDKQYEFVYSDELNSLNKEIEGYTE